MFNGHTYSIIAVVNRASYSIISMQLFKIIIIYESLMYLIKYYYIFFCFFFFKQIDAIIRLKLLNKQMLYDFI